MINRNEVAREKMSRAAEMLCERNIDMWGSSSLFIEGGEVCQQFQK